MVQIVYHLTRSHLIMTSRHPEPADITQIVRRTLREYQKMLWKMFRSYIYEDVHITWEYFSTTRLLYCLL